MKKYSIVFKIGAIIFAFLSLIFMLYFFAPSEFIEKYEIISVNSSGKRVVHPVVPIIIRFVLGILIATLIIILFIKSEKKSLVKKCSIIAITGLFLLLVSRILHMGHDFNIIPYSRWTPAFWLLGNIVVSVAILRLSLIFSYKTLSFWGGIVFFAFLIMEILACFIGFSFDSSVNNVCIILWTLSSIGMSLFFYGLTLNNKHKNGKQKL